MYYIIDKIYDNIYFHLISTMTHQLYINYNYNNKYNLLFIIL